jgi:hypothetical protein
MCCLLAGYAEWLGREVSGATVGIVGMGRIGVKVARRARAFDMRVLYTNRTRRAPEPAALVRSGASASAASAPGLSEGDAEFVPELHDLLRRSDFVVLLVPYSPQTRHLIGRTALRAMQPHATLINMGRGGLVDTDALVEALRERRIGFAALDVTDPEPLPAEHPLRALHDRVVLVPHFGSATYTTRYGGRLLRALASLVRSHRACLCVQAQNGGVGHPQSEAGTGRPEARVQCIWIGESAPHASFIFIFATSLKFIIPLIVLRQSLDDFSADFARSFRVVLCFYAVRRAGALVLLWRCMRFGSVRLLTSPLLPASTVTCTVRLPPLRPRFMSSAAASPVSENKTAASTSAATAVPARPPLVSVKDYEEFASKQLPKPTFDFFKSGACDEQTLKVRPSALRSPLFVMLNACAAPRRFRCSCRRMSRRSAAFASVRAYCWTCRAWTCPAQCWAVAWPCPSDWPRGVCRNSRTRPASSAVRAPPMRSALL